jgi:hypothetical protein
VALFMRLDMHLTTRLMFRHLRGPVASELTSAGRTRLLAAMAVIILHACAVVGFAETQTDRAIAKRASTVGRKSAVKTPETSRLFTRWRNPASGVESLILTERLAPVQKTFYFTNPSFTTDGRFLWVVCMFPPEGGMHATPLLGVVDFERDEMRVFHETQFSSASPMIDPVSGEVYWGNDLDLWKRGPHSGDKPVLVNHFPKELAKGRSPDRIATHLTFSADHKSLNIDAMFGKECFIGDMPLDGSPMRLWQKFDGWFYDHGQFSPTDPDLQMFAHEYWQDHASETFEPLRPYHRMWLIRRGEKARPILRAPVSHSGHEWWDADGKHVWYVHYGVGVKKVDIATGEEKVVWPGRLSHAYSDRTGRYLVADKMADPVVSDCHVVFRNLATGKEVEIVNRPPLAAGLTQCRHLHPHPHFCRNDRYIAYTTTVHDRVDVALTPTAELIRLTQ